MATEADTSGSELLVPDNRHRYRRQRLSHQQNICHMETDTNFRNDNKTDDENNDDEVEQLISVDDFDDSDNEDSRSCSTMSPTPSDQAVNSSVSSRHSTAHSKATRHFTNSYKLPKRHQLDSTALDEDELQSLRLKINSRERKRMHDLNSALDGLREVMPYAHGPSVRKLSKIATLLLAKNYILMLNSSLEEMKKLVSDIYHKQAPTSLGGQVPGCHPLGPQSAARNSGIFAGSNNNGEQTKPARDSQSGNLSTGSLPNKCSEVPTNFSYPPTAMPRAHITHQHTAIPSVLPLTVSGLRTPAHGPPSRDVTSLVSPHLLPKSEPCTIVGISPSRNQTVAWGSPQVGTKDYCRTLPKSEPHSLVGISPNLPARECTRHLHPWGMPCACAPCLSISRNLPLSLQLTRLSQPMVTPSPGLHRKY